MDRSKARRELGWDLIAADRRCGQRSLSVAASQRETALKRREFAAVEPVQSQRRVRN